jgi:hypothetical protein
MHCERLWAPAHWPIWAMEHVRLSRGLRPAGRPRMSASGVGCVLRCWPMPAAAAATVGRARRLPARRWRSSTCLGLISRLGSMAQPVPVPSNRDPRGAVPRSSTRRGRPRDGFEEYLLVDSRRRAVERYGCAEHGRWIYQRYGPDASITLSRSPKVWHGPLSVIQAKKRAELTVMCLETIGLTCSVATFYRRTPL